MVEENGEICFNGFRYATKSNRCILPRKWLRNMYVLRTENRSSVLIGFPVI